MDSQVSTSSSSPNTSPNTARRRFDGIYALQAKAFLDAAEVVDADVEILEDLLGGFASERFSTIGTDADVVDVGSAYFDSESSEQGDVASEFNELLHEAQTAWSKQEIKQMMTWLKEHGMASFINQYVVMDAIPIPKLLCAFGICLCPELREKCRKTLLYFLRVAISRELQSREKLPAHNTIDDAVNLIRSSRRIIVLTGAGISTSSSRSRVPCLLAVHAGVSCGIPDFRSRDGLYATLQEKGEYDLDDPQQMFDINYFRENPSVFYSFASKIYPSNFIPSPCHRFIKLIEDKRKLLRNYTQNIDTLESQAGVQRVLQCHGSFATASCLNCRIRVPGFEIEDDILSHRVPLCKVCNLEPNRASSKVDSKQKSKKRRGSGWNSDESDEPDRPEFPPGIMKPDITFFGEKLSDTFDRALLEDRHKVDLLIVIGTSLKVSPVSEILAHLPHSVPQILINKTPIRHINPDIILLGNADDVVIYLCRKLGWDLPEPYISHLDAPSRSNLKKRPSGDFEGSDPQRVGNSHVWLFEGAEGGKWVEELAEMSQSGPEGYSDPESETSPSEIQARRLPKKARTQ